MGSQMETVKDSEGNSHVIFDESSLYDDSQMGDQLSDFEILQVLSEDNTSSFVAKVRSLNNHKIYAMKKIELNKIGNFQNLKNQMIKLGELNNPHIMKYYKTFGDNNNNLYLIMEFMNNSDIYGFIKAHQVLDKIIKEEEIWNILLQCLSALDYLNSQNLGNLDIRLNNIFMNNEQNAKIGVFNDPINQGNYNNNLKDDIYSLGRFFYIMCFSQELKEIENLRVSQVNILKKENHNYSDELMNIIFKMVNQDQSQRPDSKTLYNEVKKEYVKKYARNSSIEAVLRCLYSYPTFNQLIFKKAQEYSQNKDKYYINYWYSEAISALSGAREENLTECIEEFRRAIASENSKLDGNREIDPLYLLAFLLEKMHKETNIVEGNNSQGQNQMGKYVINSVFNGEEEDKTNKEQMLHKFVTYFNANVHSIISDLFFGFVKTKRNCQTCKTGNYSFSNFCFVVFDLSNNMNNEFDILKNGFEEQYNYAKKLEPDKSERVYCERCLTYQLHYEFNRYYMMNHQLVISFIRGNNFQNNTRIVFDENINLTDFVDEKNASPTKFYLVGSINRVMNNGKEEFRYWARDPENKNIWHVNKECENHNNAPIDLIRNEGQIIMLFYNNIENIPKN